MQFSKFFHGLLLGHWIVALSIQEYFFFEYYCQITFKYLIVKGFCLGVNRNIYFKWSVHFDQCQMSLSDFHPAWQIGTNNIGIGIKFQNLTCSHRIPARRKVPGVVNFRKVKYNDAVWGFLNFILHMAAVNVTFALSMLPWHRKF
jgi:hypothetical protein